MAAGGHNSMALKSDGTVWDWGDNSAGQLGNNTTTNSSVPVQVTGLTAVGPIAIDGDDDAHSLALRSDGTVWAWGSNTNGQLGNNSTTNSHVAIQSNMSSVKLAVTQTHASYAYNGDGLRMSKTVSGAATQETWDLSGAMSLLLVDGATDYVYGPGGLPLEQLSASVPLFYYQDQLGSTRALANLTGTVVGDYTYDPYGNLTGAAVTGTVANPLGYIGQYTDAESGLVYLRARYYDPSTAQFITRDPLVALTATPYGYSGSNPLNASDPTGKSSDAFCINLTGIAARGLGAGTEVEGCLVETSSGEVGVTLIEPQKAVGVAIAGGHSVSGAIVEEQSNANSISDLGGWFTYFSAGVSGEELLGGSIGGFAGCAGNRQIIGESSVSVSEHQAPQPSSDGATRTTQT